jgi:AraC-like DNA-binding protein
MNKLRIKKNNGNRSISPIAEEEGVSLYTIDHTEEVDLECAIPQGLIQFYYAIEGDFSFEYSPHYSRELSSGKYFFMYNPNTDMKFRVVGQTGSKWIAIYVRIERLHRWFMDSDDAIPFLKGENANRVYYDELDISPASRWALESLFSIELTSAARQVYASAKMREVLALHFGQRGHDIDACPFLRDEENVRKIKHAKDILIEKLLNPPSIPELSELVDLSEYKLKTGFKEVYGNTLYGFVLDYKMNKAKALLDTGKMQVREVANELGYNNPSHFITAFKKKFAITPKKYLQNL